MYMYIPLLFGCPASLEWSLNCDDDDDGGRGGGGVHIRREENGVEGLK